MRRAGHGRVLGGHRAGDQTVVAIMRVYFVQQWFNFSDPGLEEVLYDSVALRRFCGRGPRGGAGADETTVCRFHHLLEKHNLGDVMLDRVNLHLERKGIRIATGTIVAAILHAPSSTKTRERA